MSATITIRHTHEDGTIVHGSNPGDGVWEIARQHGFIYRSDPGIHIRGSRDRDARRHNIDGLAAELREAGHTVEIDIENMPRTAAQRRDALDDRAADRADRLSTRAGRAAGEAIARRDAARALTDGRPFGQPVQPPEHHSHASDMNRLDRADAHRRKSHEAAGRAEHLAGRAAGVQAHAAYRNDPRAMMRRIDTLQTQRRGYARELAGCRREPNNSHDETFSRHEYPPAAGARVQDLNRWDARDAEEIAYLRGVLAAMEAAGTFTAWTPEHFRKGDGLKVAGHGWLTVTRVNKKSASLDTNGTWPRTITWDRVAGRRRDGLQWDTPNGEPWPVELARQVARWNTAAHRAALPSCRYDTETRHVGYAQRLVHGLDLTASAAEVSVIADSITGTDARRALAAAYLAAFQRLTAGELVPDIAASLTPITGTPAWRMPAGREPQDRRVGPGWPHVKGQEFVQPGDLLVGYFADKFSNRGGLVRHFCGPIAAVSDVVNRLERGDWVTVTLTSGDAMEFENIQHVLVHPAGTWQTTPDEPTATTDPATVTASAPDGAEHPTHQTQPVHPAAAPSLADVTEPPTASTATGPLTAPAADVRPAAELCIDEADCHANPRAAAGDATHPDAPTSGDRHVGEPHPTRQESSGGCRIATPQAGADVDALKAAARAVTRHFQHYSSEARATLAASHRAGHQQRRAVGEYFYTHPAVPGRSFDTRRAAARAALTAEQTNPRIPPDMPDRTTPPTTAGAPADRAAHQGATGHLPAPTTSAPSTRRTQ